MQILPVVVDRAEAVSLSLFIGKDISGLDSVVFVDDEFFELPFAELDLGVGNIVSGGDSHDEIGGVFEADLYGVECN